MDVTARFNRRVDYYERYRPRYPRELVPFFVTELGAGPGSNVADIGCGTGLSSELFLECGCPVLGIEPNAEMRARATEYLSRYSKFHALSGTAEATGLPDHSVDVVTAAQAFHWFNLPPARNEFLRILRNDPLVILFWYNRRTDSPFLQEYETMLLRHSTDYKAVDHKNLDDRTIADFFGPDGCSSRIFPHVHLCDLDALKGRLLSCSYVPLAGSPGHDTIMAAAEKLFRDHQTNGQVRFDYDTRVYYGRLTMPSDHTPS
jgi:SAM-dependent methyltransferase